jgi:hypothetical protein
VSRAILKIVEAPYLVALPAGALRMDVDLTIRYSDDRLSEIIASRPDAAAPLYRIASRCADLGASLTETMWEARHLFEITPWPDRRRQ